MDILASTATDAAISQLLDWGRARLSKCARRKAIERLVDETAMRAPAIPSTVDLASKFNNPRLLEELLAHRSLLDIGKDDAICLFLGEGADDLAHNFVSEFWGSVNLILSSGEESLADRKAVEKLEEVERKIDLLHCETGDRFSDWLQQNDALTNYCGSLDCVFDDVLVPRRLKMRGSNSELRQDDLVKIGRSVFVCAEPGMGKSWLMRSFAAGLARKWICGDGDRIPVLIDARGWSRQYSSLYEGAARAIYGSITTSTEAIIRNNYKNFCFFVDSLDEAQNDRDLLYDELAHFAKKEQALLICASRFEGDCKRIGIGYAALLGLEDEEIVAYLNRNGIELPRGVIDKFSATGRDLLRNPLHLNCLVEYVRNKGAGKVPKNLAEIYGACVASMIEKKVESDGGVDVDYLLYQLGSYALESLVNRSTVPCRRFLMEKLDVGEVERIEKTGKASGLLVLRDGSVGFSHAVFQEYLASVYLAKQDDATIKTFCELNSGNPLLKNLFVLLCGCTADKVKQALILDCLEESNLTLFMDCLRGRMNLSREMEEQFGKENIETIVSQALKTYTNITNIYFSQTKPFIPFWKRLSYPDALVRIEAQYDVTSTVIRIVVKERKPDEEPVLIQFCDDGHGPAMKGDINLTVPVLSLRVSNRPELHIYRIADLYGGVDCAREIAISMINDDLAGFFESAETILYEPIGMRASFVEAALQRCQNLLTDERQSRFCLSLRRNTAGELAKLIEGKEGSSIKVDGIELPLGVIPYLVRMLEIAQEDCLDYLTPEPDNICEGQRRVWQIYTDDCFEKWCGVVLPELEKSYRQFVRIFLKGLAEYLPTYAEGPFALRIEIVPADISELRSDRHLCIARYPVQSEEDIAAEFVNDGCLRDGPDLDGFSQRAQMYIRFARLLGRPGECYQEQEMRGSALLTEKAYVHNEVRKRVQRELSALFRLH